MLYNKILSTKYYHQKNHKIYKNKRSIKKKQNDDMNYEFQNHLFKRVCVHSFIFDNTFV